MCEKSKLIIVQMWKRERAASLLTVCGFCLGGTPHIGCRTEAHIINRARLKSPWSEHESFEWQRARETYVTARPAPGRCWGRNGSISSGIQKRKLYPSARPHPLKSSFEWTARSMFWGGAEGRSDGSSTCRQRGRRWDRSWTVKRKTVTAGLSWSYWCSIDFGTSASPFGCVNYTPLI